MSPTSPISMLAAIAAPSAVGAGGVGGSPSGSIAWVAVTNVIIWTGLFLYLLRLHHKVRELEKEP